MTELTIKIIITLAEKISSMNVMAVSITGNMYTSLQKTIQLTKWDNKNTKELFQSIHKLINIRSLQFYMPFFSLYFYIHNKPNATKKIDLRRNFYIKNFKEIIKERYYNSNMFLIGDIYDSSKNKIEEKELFCKCISITDAMHCINNNYNLIL